MKEIKLLIIDDDQEVLTEFSKSVERFNRDKEGVCLFKIYAKESLIEVEDILKYYKIDTAIIDLNLQENSEADNSDGNLVIEKVIENFRIPIYIFTGEPTKLEESYKQKSNITLYAKGEKSYHELLEELQEKLSLKTIDYFSRNGYLEKEINDFYWNHLQDTLDSWNNVADTHNEQIDKILSRHTVACLNEKLYVNGNIGSFDKYHPGEMYIIPPIKKHYHTGDIIEKDDELFIILNPACDIVNQGNLEFYLVAKLIDIQTLQDIQQNIKTDKQYSSLDDSLNKIGKEKFKKYSNNQSQRYHYIPKFDKISKDYLIDFQNLQNIKIGNIIEGEDYLSNRESIIKQYTRIASISSPFLKDIVMRFSTLYARQGQPNLL